MRNWPHGSTRVPVEQLAVGDIVVVPGAGAYRINHLLAAPPLGTVAVLGWDALALILKSGTSRERLNPAPDAGWHATTGTGAPATVPSRNVRDQLPLAG